MSCNRLAVLSFLVGFRISSAASCKATDSSLQAALNDITEFHENCLNRCGDDLCDVFEKMATVGEIDNMTDDEKSALPLCQVDRQPCMDHSDCGAIVLFQRGICGEIDDMFEVNDDMLAFMAPCFTACEVTEEMQTQMHQPGFEENLDMSDLSKLCPLICMHTEPLCNFNEPGNDDDRHDEDNEGLEQMLPFMQMQCAGTGGDVTPCAVPEGVELTAEMQLGLQTMAPCTSACDSCDGLREGLSAGEGWEPSDSFFKEHACAITCMAKTSECAMIMEMGGMELPEDLVCTDGAGVASTVNALGLIATVIALRFAV